MFRMIARYQPFSPTVTRKPDAAGRSVWKLETRPAAISIGDSPKVATSAGLKVCYRKLPGKHMLFLSFTCFDPFRTLMVASACASKSTSLPNFIRCVRSARVVVNRAVLPLICEFKALPSAFNSRWSHTLFHE